METLEDFNRKKEREYRAMIQPRNGIECPECGREMRDDLELINTVSPPRKHVLCSCGFQGTRIA